MDRGRANKHVSGDALQLSRASEFAEPFRSHRLPPDPEVTVWSWQNHGADARRRKRYASLARSREEHIEVVEQSVVLPGRQLQQIAQNPGAIEVVAHVLQVRQLGITEVLSQLGEGLRASPTSCAVSSAHVQVRRRQGHRRCACAE